MIEVEGRRESGNSVLLAKLDDDDDDDDDERRMKVNRVETFKIIDFLIIEIC